MPRFRRRIDRAEHARPARTGDAGQVAGPAGQRLAAPARRSPSLRRNPDPAHGARSIRPTTPGKCAAMRASSAGLCTPPPQTSTRRVPGWCALQRVGDGDRAQFQQGGLHVRRRMRASPKRACTQSRWNCSRPVLFGGGSANQGSSSRRASSAASSCAAARRRRRRHRTAWPVWRSHQASSRRWPGRCRNRAPRPARGNSVKLAMPPRFSTARSSCAAVQHRRMERRHQRRAVAAGGDVAATEVGDRGDAAALGDHVAVAELPGEGMLPLKRAPSGRWRTVCPCEPIARTCSGATPASSQQLPRGRRRRRRRSARRACRSRPANCASPPWPSATRRARSAVIPGIGAAEDQFAAPCAVAKRTSAASMPSALVPEIRPRKSRRVERAAGGAGRECAGMSRALRLGGACDQPFLAGAPCAADAAGASTSA